MKYFIQILFLGLFLMITGCCDDCKCPTDNNEEEIFWEKNYIYGLSVYKIFAKDEHVFAVTSQGIYHSSDYCDNLVDINPFPPNTDYMSIFFSIISKGDILAGSNMGLCRSTDNGVSWVKIDNFQDSSIIFYTIVEDNDGNIYAGTSKGVYISMDTAATWTLYNEGLEEASVTSMAVDEFGEVFAGTKNGLYRYNSEWWLSLNLGHAVFSFIVGNNSIYVRDKENLYRCDDYRNKYYDNKWTKMYSAADYRNISSLVITKNGEIYAGTHGDGVYLSTDKCEHWTLINSGINEDYAKAIYTLAISDDGYIYAGGYGSGIFRSKKLSFE
jgi:ligand-binding sensor domain-containing protein